MKYGSIVTAKVTDVNEKEYIVQVEGYSFTLNKNCVEELLELGDSVEGLIYENRDHKRVMITELPDIRPGFYRWAPVVQVRKDLGVFLDIGLPDKDLVLSIDDLPELMHLWPKKGDQLYVTYEVDDQNRMWAKKAEIEEIQKLFIKANSELKNKNVTATVYHSKKAGALCITPEGYSAFLHESEFNMDEPRIGEILEVRVINVREDGSINISERPRAHEALDDDSAMIKAILERNPDHFLALHDKSDPEMIQRQLGISKAQFKRAVGHLMKMKLVSQEKGVGIRLIDLEGK